MEDLYIFDRYGRGLDIDSRFDTKGSIGIAIGDENNLCAVDIDKDQLKALYYHIQRVLIEG